MKEWSLTARRTLKASHVAIGGTWMGAAVVLVLLQIPGAATVGDGVRGLTEAMTWVDDFVIIPSTIAIVLTGLLYGLRTKWGFFRFDWVIVKWVGSLLFIAIGGLALGPWIESMHEMALESGAAAYDLEAYRDARLRVIVVGGVQTVALGGLVFVSIFKPWGRRDAPPATPPRR